MLIFESLAKELRPINSVVYPHEATQRPRFTQPILTTSGKRYSLATPIGHALAGYAVYGLNPCIHNGKRPLLLPLCLALAVCPDLDFLPGILYGQPALYHQGISHSLGMATGVSLAVALLCSRTPSTVLAYWGLFTLAYGSHLLLDVFGLDGRPPYGIPIFWPISSDYYLAPVQLFWGVHHVHRTSATTGEWVSAILDPVNLGAIGIEILVVLPFVLVTRYFRHGRK